MSLPNSTLLSVLRLGLSMRTGNWDPFVSFCVNTNTHDGMALRNKHAGVITLERRKVRGADLWEEESVGCSSWSLLVALCVHVSSRYRARSYISWWEKNPFWWKQGKMNTNACTCRCWYRSGASVRAHKHLHGGGGGYNLSDSGLIACVILPALRISKTSGIFYEQHCLVLTQTIVLKKDFQWAAGPAKCLADDRGERRDWFELTEAYSNDHGEVKIISVCVIGLKVDWLEQWKSHPHIPNIFKSTYQSIKWCVTLHTTWTTQLILWSWFRELE